MLTNHQRKLYWTNLNQVFQSLRSSRPSVESHSDSIDQFRAQFHAAHNLPKSTKDFTKKNFDDFLAASAAILQPANLKPQLRAFDQPKTRLLNKILVAQAAQLRALEIPAALDYIAKICADKFHGRTPADLCADKRPPYSQPDNLQPANLRPSELEMLLFTIADRIKQLRQQRGWTQHALNLAAGLKCPCAQCRPKPRIKIAPRGPLRGELATAESNPF